MQRRLRATNNSGKACNWPAAAPTIVVALLILQQEDRQGGGREALPVLRGHLEPANHLPLHLQQRLQRAGAAQAGSGRG